MQQTYGLDFGTSNSSIAIARGSEIDVLPVDPSAANPAVLSSLLYVDHAGRSTIGADAIRQFVEENRGREIVRRRVASGKMIETVFGSEHVEFDVDVDLPGRLFQAIKHALPNRLFEGTDVFGRFWTVEELVAEVLRQLKSRADALTGREITSVVMGRPVYFSTDPKEDALAQKRLKQAARMAGFKHIRFLFEPVGAALAYEHGLSREEIAFVFDFGGGTLDFTVVRLGPGHAGLADRKPDILSVGGLVIGGNTFDEEIMEKQLMKYFGARYAGATMTGVEIHLPYWIQAHLRSWYTIPLLNERETLRFLGELRSVAKRGGNEIAALRTLVTKNYAYDLFEEIEQAKLRLSQETQASIVFHQDDIDIDEPMTRLRFEAIIASHLDAISAGIDATLRLAGLTARDVDVVLPTGGSSLIPAVQQLLDAKFGREKVRHQDVYTSVVKGLALAGREKSF
jgi:hypothetical chaperone protein